MDITLEKIELVKDRTGVSYKEAREALIKTDGNVVDAIIYIEEGIDVAPRNAAENTASKIVDDVKELVKKGNVTKILVKKDDEVVLNLPVNAGILGVVLVPWAALLSAVAALGLRCNISIVKNDGEVVDIVEKATEKFSDVRENYSSVADDLREKGSEAVSKVKEKAENVKTRVSGVDIFSDDDDYFNFDDDYPDLEDLKDTAAGAAKAAKEDLSAAAEAAAEAVEEAADEAGSAAEAVVEEAKDAAETAANKVEDLFAKAEDAAEDAAAAAKEALDDAHVEDNFEEAISGFKSRVADVVTDSAENVESLIDELINDETPEPLDAARSELDDLLAEAEKAGEEAEDALRGAAEALEDAVDSGEEKFEEAINDFKQKKRKFRFFS